MYILIAGRYFGNAVHRGCGVLGRASNRRSRWYPVNSVPAGSARDQQDDTCPGRWRAVSPAAVRCRNLPPQPGQYDTEAETTRPHSPRSRVF